MLRSQAPLALSFALLLGTNMAHGQPGRGGDGGRYGWMSDYRSALDVARRAGKPLMVVIRCQP